MGLEAGVGCGVWWAGVGGARLPVSAPRLHVQNWSRGGSMFQIISIEQDLDKVRIRISVIFTFLLPFSLIKMLNSPLEAEWNCNWTHVWWIRTWKSTKKRILFFLPSLSDPPDPGSWFFPSGISDPAAKKQKGERENFCFFGGQKFPKIKFFWTGTEKNCS